MTLDEILGMEAGPELDRLVAENVMGWIAPTDIDEVRGWLRWCEEEQRYVWAGWWIESPPTDENGEIDPIWLLAGDKVWSPSTDIADAWEVVEWLLSRGLFLDIFSPRAKDAPEWVDHPDKWSVFVCTWEREDGIVYFFQSHILSKADTLSLAICRAALAWVMRGEK